MNIHDFKLKHLELVQNDRVNYVGLLSDVMGYEDSWINRNFFLIKNIRRMSKTVHAIQQMNPKNLTIDNDCNIKYGAIDNIPFIARLELASYIEGTREENIINIASTIIAITTYSENINKDFDIESESFIRFKNRIDNTSAIQMIGLFNTIIKDFDESNKNWDNLFRSVEVIDEDYDMAGGSRMNQFNVVNTIKATCQDFNVSYKEAWQVSYILVQSNGYSKATSAYIQDQMTKIKERKFKQQRKHR